MVAPFEELEYDDLLLPDLRARDAGPVQIVARVAEVSGDELLLDRGSKHGVQPRAVFEVFRPATAVELPFSDEIIYEPQEPVAQAVVRFVEASQARATLVPLEPGAPLAGDLPAGLLAVSLPVARVPDLRPALAPPAELPQLVTPGRPVELALRLEDEAAAGLRFRWETDAGHFARALTAEPRNRFFPPGAGGPCRLRVVAEDAAAQEGSLELELTSAPATGPERLGIVETRRPFAAELERDLSFGAALSCTLEREGDGSRLVFRDRAGRELARAESPLPLRAAVLASDAVFVIDESREQVLRYSRVEDLSQLFASRPRGLGRPGSPGNARFVRPVALALAPSGYLYVLDAGQRAVQLYEPSGRFLLSFGVPGERAGGLLRPVALAACGDEVLVLDDGRKVVQLYRRARLLQEIPVGGPADELRDLCVDGPSRQAFLLEARTGVIKQVALDEGALSGRIEPPGGLARLREPLRIRLDPLRRLQVLDRGGRSRVRFSRAGEFLGRRGGVELSSELACDAGSAGELALVDRARAALYRLDREGWIRWQKVAGLSPDAPAGPWDVAIDREDRVVVLDAATDALLVFDRDGQRERRLPLSSGAARELALVGDPGGEGIYACGAGSIRLLWVDGREGQPAESALTEDSLLEALGAAAGGLPAQVRGGFGSIADLAASPTGFGLVAQGDAVAAWAGERVETLASWRPLALACDQRGLGYLLQEAEGEVRVVVVGDLGP